MKKNNQGDVSVLPLGPFEKKRDELESRRGNAKNECSRSEKKILELERYRENLILGDALLVRPLNPRRFTVPSSEMSSMMEKSPVTPPARLEDWSQIEREGGPYEREVNPYVYKIIFDVLLEKIGEVKEFKSNPDKKIALNNYLQLEGVGKGVKTKDPKLEKANSGLMLRSDLEEEKERDKLRGGEYRLGGEINKDKSKLLGDFLGEEIVNLIQKLKIFLEENCQGNFWYKRLDKSRQDVDISDLERFKPDNFLKRHKRLARMSIDGVSSPLKVEDGYLEREALDFFDGIEDWGAVDLRGLSESKNKFISQAVNTERERRNYISQKRAEAVISLVKKQVEKGILKV